MPITEQTLSRQIQVTDATRRHFKRPDPPRGLKYFNSEIVWEAGPDSKFNASHWRVYANNENNLVRECPVGQVHIGDVTATRVFVSAFNQESQLESIKVMLNTPVSVGAALSVVGLILINNYPGAGSIAWNAFSINQAGVTYSIASGNTASRYVFWDVGAVTLSSGATFTPQAGRYMIVTNVAGISDTAWDKVGLASIQESQLAIAFLQGFQIQPLATVTSIALNTTANTTILSHSPAKGGVLLSVGVRVNVGGGGAPAVSMEYTVDGGSAVTIPIYPGSVNAFSNTAKTISSSFGGIGNTAGDYMNFYTGIGFTNSILIRLLVTGSTGPLTLDVTAEYADKL